jgi:hypothetical protein
MNRRYVKLLALSLATAALALCTLGSVGASAACGPHDGLPFGIAPGCFDATVSADESGAIAATQAGSHPYSLTSKIQFNTSPDPVNGELWPSEQVRNVLVDAPPGLVGDPTVVARCTLDQLAGSLLHSFNPECPPASQVGVATVSASGCPEFCIDLGPLLRGIFIEQPVYAMVAPPDVPARFAFSVSKSIVNLDASLRSDGDYGLTVSVRNSPEALPVLGTEVTLWGVPADPSHTPQRWCPGTGSPLENHPTCAAGIEPKAFLRLPTSCSGPLTTTAHLDSWRKPAAFKPDGSPELSDPNWKEASFQGHQLSGDPSPDAPQGGTGCDQVPFDPSISADPTSHRADSPTGLSVDIAIPQAQLGDSGAIATSDLKKAVVTLPAGMSVNPSSANGQGACTSAQIDLDGRNTEPTCPDSSKIGSVTIETPLLEDSLQGEVYLAAQDDNPFKSLLAIYIVARGPGTVVKFAGHVEASSDGTLTTVFDNQPQAPVESVHLQLKGGDAAPLINPPTCGSYAVAAQLSPWSGNPPVNLHSSFAITSGPNGGACPSGGLSPKLDAGLANPVAGRTGDFVFKLSRGDGEQRLKSLDVITPSGIAAYLKGVPYCPDSALNPGFLAARAGAIEGASPSCPSASQIGQVTTGAGAGSNPVYVDTGRVYLAGPYQGEPLSLAVMVPAVAGPFDLGTVLVRAPVHVDPSDAHLSVHTELPTILQGIPLDLRSVDLRINRPDFILGPTNCSRMSIGVTATGTAGASASGSNPFQMVDCAALGFRPKLALRLSGPTHRSAHPKLRATLTMPSGGANIARAQVTLPKTEILDQAHIRTICTRVQYAADQCPKGSIYGYAKAWSPLLDQPLQGPVYLRSSSHELPDLVASLDGQIHVDLAGRIDSINARIRNTFEAVPDAPVSKFVLTMQGGKKGLLVNNIELCKAKPLATALFDGQNGKIHDIHPVVKADCDRKGKGEAHRGRPAR